MSDHIESSSSGLSLAFQGSLVTKQEGDVVMDDGTPQLEQPKLSLFTIHKDVSEITYIPEDALKEGLGMVKTIKKVLTKLELSSKLRAEVWDRELVKFVHRYFY